MEHSWNSNDGWMDLANPSSLSLLKPFPNHSHPHPHPPIVVSELGLIRYTIKPLLAKKEKEVLARSWIKELNRPLYILSRYHHSYLNIDQALIKH